MDPSAAAISAYSSGSTPCSCTKRAAKTDSTIAMKTNPTLSRSCGDARSGLRGRTGSARSGHIQNLGG